MLKFENNWRYNSPGAIKQEVSNEFFSIIAKIARGEQYAFEYFKKYFASAAGISSNISSNTSWAASDLEMLMGQAGDNAPSFIEAFYDACEEYNKENETDAAPDFNYINSILSRHESNYQIKPPLLIATSEKFQVDTPVVPKSLDQSANELIRNSLKESRSLLESGKDRQAVQEILWLLETITTAFKGVSTENDVSIEGKYFNKIMQALNANSKGTTLQQVINWLTTLHGYLSAPSGGGIRHGMDLKDGVATTRAEAKLYCDLITSYISYLLSEYERLTDKRHSTGLY